ncbi:MAG: hypothetical protein LIP16_05130, partial [Clostridium sp.]|nr:hypothetical protein [Clostridium sp.]
MKRMRQMAKRWMAVCIAASMIWTAGSQYAYAGVLPEGRPERPPLVEPAVKKQVLVNGEFEIPVDEFGQIEGWEVELSKKEGQWNKVWVEVYKNWEDSSNDSKKLAIYNGLEEDLHFSISQKIASSGYRTGIYTASVIYEGDDGRSGGVSDITFRVNGAQVKFEKLEGLMHWKQAQIGNLALQEGEPLTVEISGVLKESGALNMDDILLTPAEQFVPRVFTPPAGKEAHPPYEPVREAAPQEAEKNIQNGSFDQPLDWGVNGYPKGYLPGWTIDAEHMERWDYKIDDGMFEVKNTGGMEGIEEFALSQKVRLGVGEYTLNAESYRGWDEASREGVCMRVADPDGVLIAERYWSPGIGFMISDPFRIDQEKEVTVSFTFQLPEGKSCSLDRVNIYPHPNKIQWTSAVQTGGRSGKGDTEKIRLHFSQPVYKLKKEHFSLSGASIEDLEQEDRTTYALVLGDLTAQNDTKLTLKLKDPEYTDISPKKREVTVYRDDDGIEPMANTDFSQEVSWDREDYPDGYLPGWNLPVMDWKTWSYGVRGGIFEVSNIREAGGEARFSMNQVMKLPKGRYTIEGSSPYVRDENNPRGIWAEVKEGNRTLARVGTYPGCGIFRSEVFELEEETIVNYKVEFTLAGGKTAALDYITITPPGSVEEEELPTDLINGDFSTGVDWSLPGYPDGYVEGWTLPQPFDWERWRYVANGGSSGVFEVISKTGGGEEFSISQRIMLSAGTYVLAASSPYAYGGANREGVALTLSSDEKVIIAAAGQAGGGRFESGEFTITQDTPVTVTVTLSPGAAGAGIAIDDVEIYEAGVIVSAQWISAVQTGGEDGVTDTDGISIVFDKDIPGLTSDNFTVAGADKGRLHSYGSGDYWLEISGIDVDSGYEVNVSVRAPGYRISPSEMHVTVYSQSTGSLPDQIVNGDFSEGVDWDKGGALPGWTIEGVDWNTWSSYSGTGGEYGNFWVVRSGETSDVPLELWQEVTLPAGRYILKADSQGDWNGDLTNAITLTAEGSSGDELAKKSVQPGYGAFETDAFELDDEDTVKVTVTFVLPPGKEMGVDNVEIIGAASNGQLLSLDADLILEATPSEAVPKEDDLEDAPVGEDEFLDATPSEAVPMEKPEVGAPGPE